jgi:hypothetical protein
MKFYYSTSILLSVYLLRILVIKLELRCGDEPLEFTAHDQRSLRSRLQLHPVFLDLDFLHPNSKLSKNLSSHYRKLVYHKLGLSKQKPFSLPSRLSPLETNKSLLGPTARPPVNPSPSKYRSPSNGPLL